MTDKKMEEIKKMSIKEFRARGYLQELNRRFLHPLGLALEVVVNEDGSEELGGIWDYRDDPEGMIYGDVVVDNPNFKLKADNIQIELDSKKEIREKMFSWFIQPIERKDV